MSEYGRRDIVMEGGPAGMKHSVVTKWHFGHTNYPAVLRSSIAGPQSRPIMSLSLVGAGICVTGSFKLAEKS